jgi:hypothetical protein
LPGDIVRDDFHGQASLITRCSLTTGRQTVKQMTDTHSGSQQDYMFGLLRKVIDEIGPRPSCSEAEQRLGRLLLKEWQPVCDRVDVEPFTCSPHAFVGSIALSALLYLAAVISYWFLPPLALALAALSCTIVLLEIFRRREFVDALSPRKQGENVVGSIRPTGEASQRVIVTAHMDSAYESNIFLYLKSVSNLVIALAAAAQVVALGGCLAKTLDYCGLFSGGVALAGVGIAMIALSPVVVLFLFFTSWKAVPGACDNMSGVSVVAGLGRCLGQARRAGDWFPRRTEVVLLATSSEEASMRGARAYVRRHLKEMQAMPTYVLCLEMISDQDSLVVLRGEPSPGARHDPELVRMAREVAASRNRKIMTMQLPLPHGTDAAPFSLAGIPATCLASSRRGFNDPTYHTRHDSYERISPESLSMMLQLVIDMIRRIDES